MSNIDSNNNLLSILQDCNKISTLKNDKIKSYFVTTLDMFVTTLDMITFLNFQRAPLSNDAPLE